MIKIAFFDIDGTLVDMKTKRMTECMARTLLHLRENGVLLCIATGRAPNNVPDFSPVKFDAYMTFNGSYCRTADQVIHKQAIPREDVWKIIDNALAIGRHVSLASRDRTAANGTDPELEEYFAISRKKVVIAEDFEQFKREEIFQIMMACQEEDYAQILKGVKGAKITAWWTKAADIIPAASGKGVGVRKILDYFGIAREEAIAFGDGSNDIEMLEAVGTGIAMGNATEDVKKAADAVCRSVAEEGIYHYCMEEIFTKNGRIYG